MKPFKMTLKNLDGLKKDFAALPGRSKGNQASGLERSGWLKETTVFGENPGQLQMLSYTPPNTPAHAAVTPPRCRGCHSRKSIALMRA